MKKIWKKYRLVLAILALDLALWPLAPDLAPKALSNSWEFLGDILKIVPPVMVLMGLFDAWVPRALVENHLGTGSGARGAALAMLLGTAAAGPLYAAFPIAVSLRGKGARLANIAIFLGTWATIKIPMILMEASFITPGFALLRLGLTIPGIIVLGFLVERLAPGEEKSEVPVT